MSIHEEFINEEQIVGLINLKANINNINIIIDTGAEINIQSKYNRKIAGNSVKIKLNLIGAKQEKAV